MSVSHKTDTDPKSLVPRLHGDALKLNVHCRIGLGLRPLFKIKRKGQVFAHGLIQEKRGGLEHRRFFK